MRTLAGLLALVALFTACLDPRFPPGIAGTVYAPVSFTAALGYENAEIKPFEAIVRFKASNLARVQSVGGETIVSSITADTALLRMPQMASGARAQGVSDPKQRTLEWVSELRARPAVLQAEPNTVMRPSSVPTPNDPRYGLQWNYPQLNLPAAWDGFSSASAVGAGVTIAIVDSGILWDKNDATKRHPDFNCEVAPGVAKIAPGYDFALGDDNPYDDALNGSGAALSGYHGSHVAATAAACSNDGYGVAGVAWASRILPVRVFDGDAGTLSDVAKGMYWAAGVPIPANVGSSVPINTNPAQIINLSLGAQQAPSPLLQDAVNAANAKGVVVVVAAGNSGIDASSMTPANLQGVIVVGALGAAKELAPYSDYGALVSVVAPGGNFSRRGAPADGVLSVQGCGVSGTDLGSNNTLEGGSALPCSGANQPGSGYLQGTSMSSPHVAGVVALMMSRSAALLTPPSPLEAGRNWARVLSYLRDTSSLSGVTNCERGCGAGLVDASAAVTRAAALPAIGALTVLADPVAGVNLGTQKSSAQFTLKNIGDASANLTLTSSQSRLTFSPSVASIAPGASQVFNLTLDRAGLTGSVSALVTATDGVRQFGFRVYFQSTQNTIADASGYFIRIYRNDGATRTRINYPDTPLGAGGSFTFPNLEMGGVYDLTAYHLVSTNSDGTVVTDQLGERLSVVTDGYKTGQTVVLDGVSQVICSRDGSVEGGPRKCP